MLDTIIMYDFENGKAQNHNGSKAAEVGNCELKKVNIVRSDWPILQNALQFNGLNSIIRLPEVVKLAEAPAFTMEFIIKAKAGSERMNLIEGQKIPVALLLTMVNDKYFATASLHTQRGWLTVTTETVFPLDNWIALSLVYTGGELMVLFEGTVAARRVLKPNDSPKSIGDNDLIIGAWMDGKRNPFKGQIAGFRLWEDIAPNLKQSIVTAATTGIGDIESKYLDMSGIHSFLRQPISNEIRIDSGRMRRYQGGDIYWSRHNGTHEVHGAILKKYRALNGAVGVLGFPMSDEEKGRRTGSRKSRFQKGAIYWSAATGAHEVHGEIFARYLDLEEDQPINGGGILGLPLSDESYSPGGRVSRFEKGEIYWSSSRGAYEVHGAILSKYKRLGGPNKLGYPLSNEEDVVNKSKRTIGKSSRFERCTIYWSARTGAHEVHGAIRKLYEDQGGPHSRLGFPTSDESNVAGGHIRFNDFQNGIIIWTVEGGARAICELELYLGKVSTNLIDDGIDISGVKNDKSAEVITYTTIKIDGRLVEENKRRPSGHSGTSYDINRRIRIRSVNSDSKIYFKVRVEDWDKTSSNDYLATYETAFKISNFFGLLGGNPAGVYVNRSATYSGRYTSLDAVSFDFSITVAQGLNHSKHFREHSFWRSDNFKTLKLKRQQYADTFKNVENVKSTWDKIRNPFDTVYYELAYKNIAQKGNCFGICLEAVYAMMARSLFIEPIYQYRIANNDEDDTTNSNVVSGFKSIINDKHAFQLGASAIAWIISRLVNLEAIKPLRVFQRVQIELARRNNPVLCMNKIKIEDKEETEKLVSGHCVLPYRCEQGLGTKASPHRIWVADPNVVWREAKHDATAIEIFSDNTFRFSSAGSNYSSGKIVDGFLPSTFMFEIPFHRLASQPRTPHWEILQDLNFLIGGVVLVFGDTEVEQIKTNRNKLFSKKNGKRRIIPNGIPGMAQIPFFDVQGKIPQFFVKQGPLPDDLTTKLRGQGNGRFEQSVSTLNNTVQVSGNAVKGVTDIINLKGMQNITPEITVQTTGVLRQLHIDLTTQRDMSYVRRWEFDLAVERGATTLVQVDAASQGILIQQPGKPKPFDVKVETIIHSQKVEDVFKIQPVSASETLLLRLANKSVQGSGLIVDRLASPLGRLLDRKKLLRK